MRQIPRSLVGSHHFHDRYGDDGVRRKVKAAVMDGDGGACHGSKAAAVMEVNRTTVKPRRVARATLSMELR